MTNVFAARMVYNIATDSKQKFTLEEVNALRMAVAALRLEDQIRWERDVAIQQLADLGYSLGEKSRTSCSETPNSSKQPEIIRCKDCVNYHDYYNTKEQGERFVCALDGFIWKPEDYCSYAERRTVGVNDEID